jgi:hypothetical protein
MLKRDVCGNASKEMIRLCIAVFLLPVAFPFVKVIQHLKLPRLHQKEMYALLSQKHAEHQHWSK